MIQKTTAHETHTKIAEISRPDLHLIYVDMIMFVILVLGFLLCLNTNVLVEGHTTCTVLHSRELAPFFAHEASRMWGATQAEIGCRSRK